ncbi:MAG: acyl carrier protein [Pseudomonadales bacterium]
MTVFETLRDVLAAEFEIEPASVTLEAHLLDDLDLDSIDAVDMLARLRELTGKEIAAETLKDVRTVGDVVALVDGL